MLGDRLGDRLADRVGLLARRAGAAGAGSLLDHRDRVELAGWTWRRSWLQVGVGLCGGRGLGLQREGVDRAADLRSEDLVDEAVLLDAAEAREGRRR